MHNNSNLNSIKAIACVFMLFISTAIVAREKSDSSLVYLKAININGLRLTKVLVVQRELSLQVGQLLSKARLENNFKLDKGRLSHLQLFKKIDGDIAYNAPDTVTVDFNLTESSRYVIAPILQLSDRNFNTWYKMYNANIGRLNYGAYVTIKNIGGLNQRLMVEFQNGFNRFYGLDYEQPRLKRYKNWGIGAKVNYMNVKNYPANIKYNKQVFHRNDSLRIFNEMQYQVNATYRSNIYTSHKFTAGFTDIAISKDLLQQNENLFGDNQQGVNFLVAKYRLTQVYTNSPVYPTSGTKLELEARYNGMPFSNNINANMQSALEAFYGIYKPIYKKWYSAIHLRGRVEANNGAFFNTRALGYFSNTVRTYEYNIIHGSHFGIARGDVKYKLFDNVIYSPIKSLKQNLPFAVYPKIFMDAGYVYAKNVANNYLANTLLYSAGAGVDFHVNNNQMLRVEYGINHLKQKGLFLNFITL